MKVLHINSSLRGGSGKAALRLSQALNLYSEVESKILFDSSLSLDYQDSNSELIGYQTNSLHRKVNKLNQKIANSWRSQNKESLTPLVSLFRTNSESIRNADIIHLHWISGFIDLKSFLKNLNKPLVITLHDMWYFTGGCHYSDGCKKYLAKCIDCPELNNRFFGLKTLKHQETKKRIFKNYRYPIKIVCLSEWILKASSASTILSHAKHELIPNSVDLDLFKVQNPTELRKKYNLPLNGKILFFIAGNKNNHRKGADLLKDSFSLIDTHPDLFFISAGTYVPTELNKDYYKDFGHISNDIKMAELYALSDAFILPSREDNLPNVMLESMACGTPVISFPQGGMKDVIKNELNGYLCDSISSQSLKNHIDLFLKEISKFQRSRIREFIEKNFQAKKQADQFSVLYKNLIN